MKRFTDYIQESLLEPEADIIDKKAYYKVGSYYEDDKIKGIIASLKDNGDPHIIMSLDQPEKLMTWNEAMEYNKTLKDGWHIPTKNELQEVWHNNPKVTMILNKAIEKYNGITLLSNTYYWSSTESDNDSAWSIDIDSSNIDDYLKEFYLYIRLFITR